MMAWTKKISMVLLVVGVCLFGSVTAWGADADGVYTTPTVVPSGTMQRADSITGTTSPPVLYMKAEQAFAPAWYGAPGGSNRGNGFATSVSGNFINGDVTVSLTGVPDWGFVGTHSESGATDWWLSINGAPATVAFQADLISGGKIVSLLSAGAYNPGDTWRIDVDNLIPGPDPKDFILFSGLVPGANYEAEVTGASDPTFDSLLAVINPATGAHLADNDNLGPGSTLSLIAGTVDPSGQLLLAVTGKPPLGAPMAYDPWVDDHHAQISNYTLVVRYVGAFILNSDVVAGVGTISPAGSNPYPPGSEVEMTATPFTDYRVVRWVDGGGLTLQDGGQTYTVTMDAHKTVNVEFDRAIYELSTEVVGGNGTLAGAGDYFAGDRIDILASPDTGYQVKKWTNTDDDGFKTNANTVRMTSDKHVKVEFEPIQYTLTTQVVGGNGTLSPASGDHDYGTTVDLLAAPAPGYEVLHWVNSNNDLLTTNDNQITIVDDVTVSVEFMPVGATTYQLTTSVAGGQGSITPATGPQAADATVDLLATPADGWVVSAWSGTADDGLTTNENTVVMSDDKSVSVTFEAVTYMLSTSVIAGSGTLTPASGMQPVGATIGLLAEPAAGWRVKQWAGTADDGLTTDENTVVMSGPKSVGVEFEEIEPGPVVGVVALTVNDPAGGSVGVDPAGTTDPCMPGVHSYVYTPDDPNNPDPQSVTLTGSPDSGYAFSQWTDPNGTVLGTDPTLVVYHGSGSASDMPAFCTGCGHSLDHRQFHR